MDRPGAPADGPERARRRGERAGARQPGPRAADRPPARPAAADRPRVQVRARRAAADRRRRDRGRVHDRRGELQGVLLHAGRARPARARTSTATACTCASRPAAARRRSSLGSASSNTGELFGNAVAVPLGNRPFYPGTQAAVPAERAVLPADAAEPQRPGGRQVGADGPGRAGRQEGAAASCARSCGRSGPRRTAPSDRDPQALARLRGDHRPARRLAGRRRCSSWPTSGLRCRPACRCSGKDFVDVEAELATAQAVTPGQGQTVNIAGVEVGEISSVKLESGKAVIGLEDRARARDDLPRRHASCMRPKTGLKDMVAELTPGTPGGRRAGRGRARSRPRRRCRTSTSTRSSPRSTPTRATT